MSKTFKTKLGDRKTLIATLFSDGAAINLDTYGAISVQIHVRQINGPTVFVMDAGFSDKPNGKVYYSFDGSEFEKGGVYQGEWRLETSYGPVTFPDGNRYFTIEVGKAIE